MTSESGRSPAKRLFPGGCCNAAARKERERQGMKEITRKKFIGGMAAMVALGWRGAFAAPASRQRNYDDMTWWDPYVENITDVDTYLRRKFRQDVTDKSTGVGVEALKKILAEIVAAGKASNSAGTSPAKQLGNGTLRSEAQRIERTRERTER